MSERISRLTFEELSPALQQLLESKYKRLGYLGEFFRCTGHQPGILAPFMEMTDALKDALPDRLTELGALSIAVMMKNEYEKHQHERLSVKLGFGHDWVAAVEKIDPDNAESLSDTERTVQRLVIAAVRQSGQGVADELEAVIDAIGPDQALAVLFLVGRYITHAIIVNSLQLAAPVPSVFDEEKA